MTAELTDANMPALSESTSVKFDEVRRIIDTLFGSKVLAPSSLTHSLPTVALDAASGHGRAAHN